MGILKSVGYFLLALIAMGIILGIFTFLMLVKALVAAILFLVFLFYVIKTGFEYLKHQRRDQG